MILQTYMLPRTKRTFVLSDNRKPLGTERGKVTRNLQSASPSGSSVSYSCCAHVRFLGPEEVAYISLPYSESLISNHAGNRLRTVVYVYVKEYPSEYHDSDL